MTESPRHISSGGAEIPGFDFRMADVFTPEKRSAVMALIRGRDTKPELTLRSLLHRAGYRFTVRGPLNRSLPGRPDLVLPKYRTVVFVHGCFWHGHAQCPAFRLPKSRIEFWQSKITGNQARDLRNERALRALGWHVVTIWECALRKKSDHPWLAKRIPALLQQLAGGFQSVEAGHGNVHQHHIGLQVDGQIESLPSIPRLADHIQIRFQIEHHADSLAHQGVIFS